jgi:cytidylate kinase
LNLIPCRCIVFSNHFASFISILFLGPPGAGKSTTGMLLARKHGYIYYEADCFGMFANPFVDPNVEEPTLQVLQQKPLKVLIQIF